MAEREIEYALFVCCLFLDRLSLTLGQWTCWNKHQPRHLENSRRGLSSCEGTSHTHGPPDGAYQSGAKSAHLHNLVRNGCWDTYSHFSALDQLLHHGQLKQTTYNHFTVKLKVCFFLLLLIKTHKRSSSGPFHWFLWKKAYSRFVSSHFDIPPFSENECRMASNYFWMTHCLHVYPGWLLLPRKTTEPSSIFCLSAQL